MRDSGNLPEEIRATMGTEACCARTASGHAAAAPPSSEMSVRRFTARCLPCFPTERIAHLGYGRRLLRCGISILHMTAWGHERPKGDVRVESVRLPTADIDRRGPQVAFVPPADIRCGLKYSPTDTEPLYSIFPPSWAPGDASAKKTASESVDAGTTLRPPDGIVGQRCLLAAHRSGGRRNPCPCRSPSSAPRQRGSKKTAATAS